MSTGKDFDFLQESLTIDGAMNAISVLEDHTETSLSPVGVKLRSYTNQVVIATDEFVYKIYEIDAQKQAFDHMVRVALSEIYQELGLTWNLSSFKRDGRIFDFEQRQNLEVCNSNNCGGFENILLSISEIYKKVEQNLKFDEILKELKKRDEFSRVSQLKLSRTNFNKYNDYAMFGEQAILLDDAEFCIVLLDEENEVLDIQTECDIEVSTKLGHFLFKKFMDVDKQGGIYVSIPNCVDQIFHAWKLVSMDESYENTLACNTMFNSLLLTERDAQRAISVQTFDCPTIKNKEIQEKECADVKKELTIIESDLAESSEKKIYEKLDNAKLQSADVVLCTRLNPDENSLNENSFVNWASHMTTISTHYPDVKKQTSIFLEEDFCKTYLDGNFSFKDFCAYFKTDLKFEISATPRRLSRTTFRKFVLKLARQDKDLLAHFFTENKHTEKNQVHGCKNDHDEAFRAYSDDEGCIMCDFDQIINGINN